MDQNLIARRFIVLARKLRDDVRKALSTLHGDFQKQIDAIRDATKRENQTQKPELPTLVVQAELHVPENIERDRQTHENRQHRLQVWVVIGTWAAFIAASIYAFVAILQWREMIGATDAAQRAVDESRRNRVQAEKSLNATIEQFQLDQRAWVGISDQNVEELSAQTFKAQIEFFNSGKTPARRMQRSVSITIHPLPLIDGPDAEAIKSLRLYGNSVLPPQGKLTVTPLSDPQVMQKIEEILKTHYASINAGTEILYVFGEIRYHDISERPHVTKYCLYTGKVRQTPIAWKLGECNKFNEMD